MRKYNIANLPTLHASTPCSLPADEKHTRIINHPSDIVDAEVGKWANYSFTVESTEGNSFKWCLAIPGSEKIHCAPPERLQNKIRRKLNNSIEIVYSYNNDSLITSLIALNVTEELDGTVVQCQYGSMTYGKMSLLRVESVSEAEVSRQRLNEDV